LLVGRKKKSRRIFKSISKVLQREMGPHAKKKAEGIRETRAWQGSEKKT